MTPAHSLQCAHDRSPRRHAGWRTPSSRRGRLRAHSAAVAAGRSAHEHRAALGLIIGIILAIPLIVFLAQNTQSVEINFINWSAQVPLVSVLAATVVLTVVITEVIGLFVRRRRRKVLAERAELRRSALRRAERTVLRLVVVGGDAAGLSAASQARRRRLGTTWR